MKSTLLTVAALVSLVCSVSAQELQMDSTTKKWMYRGVIAVDSAGAGVLYDRARVWVASSYKDRRDAVQYESKEDGKVIARGNWPKIKGMQGGDVYQHTLIIEVRDGRLRYTFTDLVIEHNSGLVAGSLEYMENTAIRKNRARFAERCSAAAVELERALKAATSDW